MSKKTEEEGIKAIADALRLGGTLLNAACPVCNSPLIKINDRVYCKVCDKEVLIYRDERELPKDVLQILKKSTQNEQQREPSKVEKTILDKLEALREKLDATDDPDEIIKYTEAIDKLHSTLMKIRNEN